MEKIIKVLSGFNEYINKLKLEFKMIDRDNVLSFIKKRRYLISIILVSIISLIMIGGELITSSRHELLNDLEISMRRGNGRKIYKNIIASDNKLSKRDIDPLIKYYNSDSSKIDNVINELKTTGKSSIFKIKSSRRGIFKNYYLEIDTVDLRVNTNFKEAKIFIDNKEIDDSNVKTGLIPGTYTVKVMLQTEYGDVIKEKEVSLIENDEVSIDLDVTYLNIMSNFPDSKVFINDKYINKSVIEANGYGPIPLDRGIEIYLEREFPWGTIKSDKVNIDNSPSININISMVNEKLISQIEQSINEFYKSVFKALNERDYNLINLTNEEVKKNIYEEINKKSLIFKNNYEISELDTKIENSEFKYEDNIYKAQIVVRINYSIYKKLFPASKEKKEVMFHTSMELNSDEWIVTEVQKFTLE